MAKNHNPNKATEKPKETQKATEATNLPAEAVKAPALDVPANAALIEWPTDKYGLTKDVKKAIVALASRIGGHTDKKALADETLAIGLAHIEAKFAMETKQRAKKLAKLAAEAEAEEATETEAQLQLF